MPRRWRSLTGPRRHDDEKCECDECASDEHGVDAELACGRYPSRGYADQVAVTTFVVLQGSVECRHLRGEQDDTKAKIERAGFEMRGHTAPPLQCRGDKRKPDEERQDVTALKVVADGIDLRGLEAHGHGENRHRQNGKCAPARAR